ncbi:hypothetical protein [Sphingomonas sp. KR3-1]|uniref:hypothetical protein n=1 Tax=Sphingomonas sp. KR3-1 TaxID=3156611 RepID=UPI0032B38721
MGSIRQWATMIRHVHKTHIEDGIEEETGETLALSPDEADAAERRAEENRVSLVETGPALA